MKNGIGLYMPWFWMPLASSVHSTSFCPRLSRPVKDSPQPKIFSPGDSVNAALKLRE